MKLKMMGTMALIAALLLVVVVVIDDSITVRKLLSFNKEELLVAVSKKPSSTWSGGGGGGGGDDQDKFDQITHYLESFSKRYYIYNHTNLTMPHIRAKAFDPQSKPSKWGRQRWTKRFKSYAQGELRYHQALERHPLRTDNVLEADMVVIPIPIGAALFWGTAGDVEIAFDHLFHKEPYFQEHPEKHVIIVTIEKLFRIDHLDSFAFSGYTRDLITKLVAFNVTLVKDVDFPYFAYATNHSQGLSVFHKTWSMGYAHESSNPSLQVQPPLIPSSSSSLSTSFSLDYHQSKSLHFFYHTRDTKARPYLCNGTIFREAPIANETLHQLATHNNSLGGDIPYEQWYDDLHQSKFCLIIRGDNPSSRGLFKAIRVGCLPIVVSDLIPYYHPIFRDLISYDDFTIQLPETESYLTDTATVLMNATTNLTNEQLQSKLKGLALVQRMLVLDYPDDQSLFVPAFVHETLASQQPGYYKFDHYRDKNNNFNNSNISPEAIQSYRFGRR